MVIWKSKKVIYDAEEKQQEDIRKVKELLRRLMKAELEKRDDFPINPETGSSYYADILMLLQEMDVRSAGIQNRCHDFF